MSSRPEPRNRAELTWVAVLLGIAFALRVLFVLLEQPGFYFEDSLDYDRAARAYLETGRFGDRYYRFPLYPLVMAASYKLFGFGLIPLRVFQAVLGAGTCLCVWVLGRRLFGVRAALLALFGAAVFPVHVVLAGIEYPVAAGTFLIWCVMALLVVELPWGIRPAVQLVFAGVGLALSALLFEGGWVLGLFVSVWMLIRDRSLDGLRALSIVGLTTLLILAPWLYGMTRSGDYRTFILRTGIHLPTAPGIEPPVWKGSGENLLISKLSGFARQPGWALSHAWAEFLHFWNPYPDRLASADEAFRQRLHEKDARMAKDNLLVGDLARLGYAAVFSALMATAAVGALVALRTVPASAFLVGWPVVLGACYAPFFTQMRYRIPADPAFILLGAYVVDLALRRSLWAEVRGSMTSFWKSCGRILSKVAGVQHIVARVSILALFADTLLLGGHLCRQLS